ncbi:MAG: hypothetical protein ACLPXB_08865 [Thiobacillaceae bacterium]
MTVFNGRHRFASYCRRIAAHFIRGLVKTGGGVMLSEYAYRQLLLQRKRAVSALVSSERMQLKPGVTGIVFSKDRALQLYALLNTYFEHVRAPAPLFIVYTASTDAHDKAYAEIEAAISQCPVNVTFVREGISFRDSVLQVLDQIGTTNLFFLVDDIVFIKPLDLEIASELNPLDAILSFRHSPHLRRSYTASVKQTPPTLAASRIGPDLLEFKWFEQGNEWSDPWSLDGQVLSTTEVRVLTRLSDFMAPNTYESALKSFNDIAEGRSGLCYSESRIVNLPINRVQSEIPNLSGTVSPEFLLDQWNKGLMMDTQMFEGHIPTAPHEEHAIRLRPRRPFECPLQSSVAITKDRPA